MDLNVLIMAYDDLEQLRQAVSTIPENIDVYVVDGRYDNFEGDSIYTEEIESWASNIDRVKYYKPDRDILFGADLNINDKYRPGVTQKGQLGIHEVVPQEEWLLRLDTDERITHFDFNEAELNKHWKYCIEVNMVGEEYTQYLPRVIYPKFWTVWTDDIYIPRKQYPRDTDIKKLYEIHKDQTDIISGSRRRLDTIKVDHCGVDRDADYLSRRADHLSTIERYNRANEYKDILRNR